MPLANSIIRPGATPRKHKSGRKRVPRALKPGYADWRLAMYAEPGFFIEIQTINELNDHGHWRGRQRRAKQHHAAVALSLRSVIGLPRLPVRVTFTRYSPGNQKMDTDGAFAAMKFVRDAVAEAYGVDDGGEEIEWAWPVKQVTRAADYGVRIEIAPLPSPGDALRDPRMTPGDAATLRRVGPAGVHELRHQPDGSTVWTRVETGGGK